MAFAAKCSKPYLKVAVSAMISPKETFAYYKKLFGYISRKTNKKIKIIQRKTYSEVNKLLNNNAEMLGIPATTLHTKMSKYDIR